MSLFRPFKAFHFVRSSNMMMSVPCIDSWGLGLEYPFMSESGKCMIDRTKLGSESLDIDCIGIYRDFVFIVFKSPSSHQRKL